MNIYEKLQTCRVELQNAGLKKSGENKFSGYDYFELADFLPKTNELFLKHKLCGLVSFGQDMAVLEIVNIEKPDETITFTSPMSEAKLKGCHEVQNLGAVETYQRRYLYMAAMEIVEKDPLDLGQLEDKTTGNSKLKSTGKSNSKSNTATKEQINRITALAKEKGLENTDFWNYLKEMEEAKKISSQYSYNKDKKIQWTVDDIKVLEADLETPF